MKSKQWFRIILSLFIGLWVAWGIPRDSAIAQDAKPGSANDKGTEAEGADSFTSYGLISIANRPLLSKDRRHIAFKVQNNTGRSITNLFGWVYEYEEDENGRKRNFLLANYPHKGGVCLSGTQHKPGRKAKWRFVLRRVVPADSAPKFILLVNIKSIYFAKVESVEPLPPKATEEGGAAKEKEEKPRK